MTKPELRKKQIEDLGRMVEKEWMMANEIHIPVFRSPMEGLGVIQEEMFEAGKCIEQLKKQYHSFQTYLCDHHTDAASQIAQNMAVEALKTAQELIQVAAMCHKFRDSAILW